MFSFYLYYVFCYLCNLSFRIHLELFSCYY